MTRSPARYQFHVYLILYSTTLVFGYLFSCGWNILPTVFSVLFSNRYSQRLYSGFSEELNALFCYHIVLCYVRYWCRRYAISVYSCGRFYILAIFMKGNQVIILMNSTPSVVSAWRALSICWNMKLSFIRAIMRTRNGSFCVTIAWNPRRQLFVVPR